MTTPAPNPAKPSTGRLAALVILFVLVVPLQFVFENSDVVLENVQMPRPVRNGIERAGSMVHSRFAFLPRPLEARYVASVSISEESEGPLHGPCEVRSFLLDLLRRLVEARPTMIVSDIALGGENASDTCPPDAKETRDLANGIVAAAKTTPLIIGQASYALDELPEARAGRLRELGFGPNDLLLRKPIRIEPKPKEVAFGLIRLNRQFEKVPIVWFSHLSESAGSQPYPALALTAAESYRATFPDGASRLRTLETKRYHPTTALLSESAFAVVPAIRVLCEDVPPPELHGRVVVLGFSDHANDLWNTSAGRMPGYVLQANYVEALLDDRAYRPLTFVQQFVLSLLWFALVEVPFWFIHSIWRALILSAGVSIIVLFLAIYVALVNFGLYVSLFAPSVLIILAPVVHGVAQSVAGQGVTAKRGGH